MLPNLLIIGAPKAGTTSLHEYLALHPEIFMSTPKELKFFTAEDWRSRVGSYGSRFEDAPIRGESSPNYSLYPSAPDVAERASELIPQARVIYLVREPIARTVAHYLEAAALRFEDRSIEEALADDRDPANPYICGSSYGSQIERFYRHFDADRVLVLDQMDLLERREATLRGVFEFLEVDPDFSTPRFEWVHNLRAEKGQYNRLGHWLLRRDWLTRRRTEIRRGRLLLPPLHRLLYRRIDTELLPATRARLVAKFTPEVERLRRLTGSAFPYWSDFP